MSPRLTRATQQDPDSNKHNNNKRAMAKLAVALGSSATLIFKIDCFYHIHLCIPGQVGIYMELRKQLARLSFLIPPCVFWELNTLIIGLGTKGRYLLSSLAFSAASCEGQEVDRG